MAWEENKDQIILGQHHTFAKLEEQKTIKIIFKIT